jgi:serine/threonine protein kinase
MTSPCSRELLESALIGDLPPDREELLERHLDDCEACATMLTQLAGGEAWRREAASMLTADELDEALRAREEWSTVDFTVEHLEPAEEPNSLGRLGGYDVLEIVGRGGMGVVLKAFDPELKRCVAIKVLSPHLAQSSLARKRFTREAQAAAAVVHHNVMAIHNVQSGGRLPFLVMPLVTGESLAQRLAARGRLELKETLRIGMQAAAALAAAHEQGLVHRDVKPANILLEKGVERVLLTDFGLARAADDVSMTRWGIISGTPQYMSPEQAKGEAFDGRSDLFSLGCVLFEMSTGVSPFRADSTMATLRRLIDDAPSAMASLNPELPPWFIGLVERLLEKDPSQRFSSAQEVSELLEGCLAHLQQPASTPLPAGVPIAIKTHKTNPSGDTAIAQTNVRQRIISRKGVAIMLALIGISLFAVGYVEMAPQDISGRWSGEDWGQVELAPTAAGEYTGTFTNTVSKQPGKIALRWSRIEHRFNGTWSEGEERFGTLSVRMADNQMRGAWTTDSQSKTNPGTPKLADLLWKRGESRAVAAETVDPTAPAAGTPTTQPTPVLPPGVTLRISAVREPPKPGTTYVLVPANEPSSMPPGVSPVAPPNLPTPAYSIAPPQGFPAPVASSSNNVPKSETAYVGVPEANSFEKPQRVSPDAAPPKMPTPAYGSSVPLRARPTPAPSPKPETAYVVVREANPFEKPQRMSPTAASPDMPNPAYSAPPGALPVPVLPAAANPGVSQEVTPREVVPTMGPNNPYMLRTTPPAAPMPRKPSAYWPRVAPSSEQEGELGLETAQAKFDAAKAKVEDESDIRKAVALADVAKREYDYNKKVNDENPGSVSKERLVILALKCEEMSLAVEKARLYQRLAEQELKLATAELDFAKQLQGQKAQEQSKAAESALDEVRQKQRAVDDAVRATRAWSEAAHRVQSQNNLRQIALAVFSYESTNGKFPPAYIADKKTGKPLLSWRVAILPYIEQDALYRQFHLDERWDSEHNKKLAETVVAVYRSPIGDAKPGMTNYLTVRGKDTAFPGKDGIKIMDIRDGTSNTIMLVEADNSKAVPWTKPEDLPYDEKNPSAGLGGLFSGGFNAAMCDGSARFIPSTIDAETLRRLFNRSDGEPVDLEHLNGHLQRH